jgi:Tol biopolymer transport system component/DNA-binding winged helix-turn-helix (wHTH) protein
MTAIAPSPQDFHKKISFGDRFVLELERFRLVRDGEDVKLRPKAFEVLRYLVQHQGRVVSKEELFRAIWSDAIVTDDALVQCVKDVRRALNDDSQQWLKTVPRRGYIFEASNSSNGGGVTEIVDAREAERPSTGASADASSVETVTAPVEFPVQVLPRQSRTRWLWPGVALLSLLAMAGAFAWYPRTAPNSTEWSALPLTSYPGNERNPSLSPDSNTVAFTWDGEARDNFDIYIQAVGSSRPQRLTSDPAQDTSPEWSPDGRTIAFLRRLDRDRNQLILIPSTGGPEHVLAETRDRGRDGNANVDIRKNLAWTPDGLWIVVPHREGDGWKSGLYLVSVTTGSKRPLTLPPPGAFRDQNPALSPDGRTLAFVRLFSDGLPNLYIQPLSKDFFPTGQVKQLTTDGKASHPAWTPDGRLLYIEQSRRELRMVTASTSDRFQPVLLEKPIDEFSFGRHIVFTQRDDDADIYRAQIPSPNAPPVSPQLFIYSTRADTNPEYSPDGKVIAFRSQRSSGAGAGQIWISNADGSNPMQLTFLEEPAVFPQWSPNGHRILFHRRVDGPADLFSISVIGGQLKRLTSDPSEDRLATYSRDGKWIYFQSHRSGQSEFWKMPSEGGEATRLTFGGSYWPVESPDGRTLFYVQEGSELTIWKVPVQGGTAEQVTGPIAKDPAFAVTDEGIYYKADSESPPAQRIQFLSFSTGEIRTVVVTEQEVGLGLSLSPDGKYLIFAQRNPKSDLMLIKDFVLPR